MDETPNNKGKNKGHANLIPVKKGEVRNPNGRPKGQRDYATIYKEALIILADKNSTTPEALEAEMVANGALLARKGDYRFYKDVLDRIHGQAVQKIEANVDFQNEEAIQKANKLIKDYLGDTENNR